MKRLLKYPQVYNFYQRLIGADSYLKKFAYVFLNQGDNIKILDLGCGTSNILKFLTLSKKEKNISYVGIDVSEKYIEYTKKKFPDGVYFVQSVCDQINVDMKFDLIICLAVMAALDDDKLKDMFGVICSKANMSTKIILSDMNCRENANALEKFFYRNERNSYVRREEEYRQIITQYFNIDKVHYWDNVYRIPYSKVIFECSIKN